MTAALDVSDLAVRFGGIRAVDGVTFALERGGFLGLIGPNGAGKTTLLRIISGAVPSSRGSVLLDGHDVTRVPPHDRARLGLAITHQIVRPFRTMSILDNVTFAAGHGCTGSILSAFLSTDRSTQRARAVELLELVGIAEHDKASPNTLPLGALKRLEVARALALDPNVLLLDEPLAGLNHIEAARLADTIAELNGRGITIILIEHNLREVLRVCRRLFVLDNGRAIADGAPTDVMRDPAVRAAYIGLETVHAAA